MNFKNLRPYYSLFFPLSLSFERLETKQNGLSPEQTFTLGHVWLFHLGQT